LDLQSSHFVKRFKDRRKQPRFGLIVRFIAGILMAQRETTMEIYLLRHAQAVEPSQKGFEIDSDRSLTREGKARMRRVARAMKRLGLDFNIIVTSPYLRARQTAEIVARILGAEDRLMVSNHLAPTGKAIGLIAELHRRYSYLDQVLLVGHEPYLSSLVAKLVTGKSCLALSVKKAALVKLNAESLRYSRCARLEWLIPPKVLAALG
jgi:phosphohistidine phosphatase